MVELVRRTRAHPDIRVGSSVRGAIDLVRVATSLAVARAVPVDDWKLGLDAAFVSLSGRIRLAESAGRTPETIVRQLYEDVFDTEPADDEKSSPDGDAPGEAVARHQERAAQR
ncbi:hypothetical protein ABIB25_001022 [Nakamurella sp. UYEF19]|uniref:hypothetical protein n=1 Tax=Nakamurella sp. UYEF19 TaxID=1756392 RepID=UPI0033937967